MQEGLGKAKKTRKKRRFRFGKLLMFLTVFVSCVLLFFAYEELKDTFTLKREIADFEQEKISLQDQKDELAKEKANLENPEYVARFARGKFMVSKPGEQIFKLPAKNASEDDHD